MKRFEVFAVCSREARALWLPQPSPGLPSAMGANDLTHDIFFIFRNIVTVYLQINLFFLTFQLTIVISQYFRTCRSIGHQ